MKAANPGLSVCEVGAAIGRIWRELSDTDKQHYNDEFATDKVLQFVPPIVIHFMQLKFMSLKSILV